MKQIEIYSPNVVKDKEFRRHLNSVSKSSDEAFEVVRQALEKEQFTQDETLKVIKADLDKEDFKEREEIEVKAKLFLTDFSIENAETAVNRICESIGSTYIDNLQVAVPTIAVSSLAIAMEEKEKNKAYHKDLEDFVKFLTDFEPALVKTKKVLGLGLCDIETESVKEIYRRVNFKPRSITLNLQSCCLVPPELQAFAQENSIKLLTHNDPEFILSDQQLKKLPGSWPQLAVEWVTRYQVMDKARGVLKTKRYIIGLKVQSP